MLPCRWAIGLQHITEQIAKFKMLHEHCQLVSQHLLSNSAVTSLIKRVMNSGKYVHTTIERKYWNNHISARREKCIGGYSYGITTNTILLHL